MLNVWRAPFRTTKPSHLARFKICYVLHHFGDCCPRSDSVRNVWRAVCRCVRALLPGPVLMPFSRRCVSWWIFGPGDVKMTLLGRVRRRLSPPTVGHLEAKGLVGTRGRSRVVNIRICETVFACMGAIGASFEFAWMSVHGREGVDFARRASPALVEVTAVALGVGLKSNSAMGCCE